MGGGMCLLLPSPPHRPPQSMVYTRETSLGVPNAESSVGACSRVLPCACRRPGWAVRNCWSWPARTGRRSRPEQQQRPRWLVSQLLANLARACEAKHRRLVGQPVVAQTSSKLLASLPLYIAQTLSSLGSAAVSSS